MWLSTALAAPFVVPAPALGVFPDEAACEATCTQTCATDEATGEVSCLTSREAELREALYGCEAACDGGCERHLGGITCFPGGDRAYAQTASRLRETPSTEGRIVRTLPAGTPIPIHERRDDWIRTEGGWVHASLLAPTWVGPPDPTSAIALHGWPIGLSADGDTLFEVVDHGGQGAVDGSWLWLCSRRLVAGAAPECVHPQMPDPMRTDHLAHLWNEHGLKVQEVLRGAKPAVLVPVSAEDAGISVATDADGATSVSVRGTVLWTAADEYERGSLDGVHRLGDRLLIALAVESLAGCCEERVALVVSAKEQTLK